MHRVASVTVTWNGGHLLLAQIEMLLKQTEPPQEIVIIDNASTDGSCERLGELHPSVTVIRLSANEGVGGGYSRGLEYAIAKGYDWIWLLDQDSSLPPLTLAKLLEAWENIPGKSHVGMVAPVPVDVISGISLGAFHWRHGQVPVKCTEAGAVSMVDLVISSGALIRAEAVKKAGLPRADFFIDFVDFEHCLRLRKCGYQIAVVHGCRMPHVLGNPRMVSFFGRPRLRTTHAAWRDYYKVRNPAYVVWHDVPTLRTKLFLMWKFFVHAVGILLYDPQKLLRFKYMATGLRDGVHGRLGIRVRPEDASAKMPRVGGRD